MSFSSVNRCALGRGLDFALKALCVAGGLAMSAHRLWLESGNDSPLSFWITNTAFSPWWVPLPLNALWAAAWFLSKECPTPIRFRRFVFAFHSIIIPYFVIIPCLVYTRALVKRRLRFPGSGLSG